MTSNNFLAIPPRKQPCLLGPSSQRAGPSTRTQHRRNCSPTSLPPYSSSLQADLDNLLDPLDDTTLDSDQLRSASSATLLSHRISTSGSTNQFLSHNRSSSESDLRARLSESRQSCLYPLHVPGQMTAQRTQRLRSRTAAVIKSLPATSEEVVQVDDHEPHNAAAVVPTRKLRRISGVRDLRRAFYESGSRGPVHFASLGVSKICNELGVLATPVSPPSHLSLRSSSRTLVDFGSVRHQSSGDQKTLCGSTLSSISITSRLAKVYSTLPAPRPSHIRSPSDTSQSIYSRKPLVHNSLTPRPHRHVSLQLHTPTSWATGEVVWSCAKISQSAAKRTARRGQAPRRVFSNPIAILAS